MSISLHSLASLSLRFLFWPWNIVLCALALFGYLPFVLKDQVLDAVDGLARWDFVVGSLILIAVPLATTGYAWFHRARYRDEPAELAELFFGVELPLLACTAARLFGFHQLGHAAQFVYVALVAGGLIAEGRLVLGARFPRGQLFDGLSHGFLTLRLVAGAYVGFLLANLSAPLLLTALYKLSDADEGVFVGAVVMFPITMFLVGSALLVLTLPVTAPLAWWHALKHSGRELRAAWGLDDLLFTTGAPIVVAVVGFIMFVPQPHKKAMEALQKAPANDDERRALVAMQDEISMGLVDAWLGRHTYAADNRNDVWARLWSIDGQLISHHELQDVNEKLNAAARPFTFDGIADEATARRLYREFFGRDIERDHAEAARAALASTWSREARFAGFINEGQQRARLESQSVTVRVPAGDSGVAGVFDVEIHDEWANQTTVDQEVSLFFELPESAAVTGLWLSPTDNKADGAAFMVTPRGAAQQMYREQVRAKRDPALLEQVGPQQYRLRVFPIPARPPRQGDQLFDVETWAGADSPRIHVWLAYQALPDRAGHAPLPVLRERRNGFWDTKTRRSIGSVDNNAVAVAAVAAEDAAAGGEWVQGQPDAVVATQVVSAVVAGDCVRLTPWAAPAVQLQGQTVDVVIDRSLEMADHKDELKNALAALAGTGARLRFLLGTSTLRGEGATDGGTNSAIDVDELVFFGAASAKDLLRQLIQMRPSPGDAVVVLTGTGSFDVADDAKLDLSSLPGQKLPKTLLVHLAGGMPRGYDDSTLDAVRRSGGTATDDVAAALARLSPLNFVDGRRVDVSAGCGGSRAALPVVARQAILLADRGGIAPLAGLDRLHKIAIEAGVITPYSSMLVLLTPGQLARLRQLTDDGTRFDREVGDVDGPPVKVKAEGQVAKDNWRAKSAPPPVAPAAPTPGLKEALDSIKPRPANEPDVMMHAMSGKRDGAVSALRGDAPATQNKLFVPSAPVVTALEGRADNGAAAGSLAERNVAADEGVVAVAAESVVAANVADNVDDVPAEHAVAPTPPPAVPQVSGVPEPHEWLLILLAAVAVVVMVRRRVPG